MARCCGLRANKPKRSAANWKAACSRSLLCSGTIPGIENGNCRCLAMHLAPRELEKLVLHNAGFLAQKRLARGLRLNHPESIALIATQLLEFIRDGKSVAELMDLGKKFL